MTTVFRMALTLGLVISTSQAAHASAEGFKCTVNNEPLKFSVAGALCEKNDQTSIIPTAQRSDEDGYCYADAALATLPGGASLMVTYGWRKADRATQITVSRNGLSVSSDAGVTTLNFKWDPKTRQTAEKGTFTYDSNKARLGIVIDGQDLAINCEAL